MTMRMTMRMKMMIKQPSPHIEKQSMMTCVIELYYLRHLRSIAATAFGAHGNVSGPVLTLIAGRDEIVLEALAAGMLYVIVCVALIALRAALVQEIARQMNTPCSYVLAAAIASGSCAILSTARSRCSLSSQHGFIDRSCNAWVRSSFRRLDV